MSNTKMTSTFCQKRLKLIIVPPLKVYNGFYVRKINKLDPQRPQNASKTHETKEIRFFAVFP